MCVCRERCTESFQWRPSAATGSSNTDDRFILPNSFEHTVSYRLFFNLLVFITEICEA